jgi:diacylglycerol kinase (ATP)
MDDKPTAKTGIARIWAALFYSLHGLKFAISKEAAFRQELIIIVLLLIVLLFLPLSFLWKGLLFFVSLSVLIVELLNSAIEAIVDMASLEYHILAKRAKDLGSAAVLVSIVLGIVLWCGAMLTIFLHIL